MKRKYFEFYLVFLLALIFGIECGTGPRAIKAGFSMHKMQAGCTVKSNKMHNKVDLLKIYSQNHRITE